MKLFAFITSSVITLLLVFSLEFGIQKSFISAGIPALGKFLNPFNGFWQNGETLNTRFPKTLDLEGLKGKVTVKYDDLMIPHIFAKNDHDLYLAQGYVTASHRLWQMEFQTHFAAGRLSEIFGKDALPLDRRQRRIGMVTAAENSIKTWKESRTSFAIAESYAEGVNQYIEQLSYADLPLEYKLLGYEPETWTPLKSALMMTNMAQTLNTHELDLENTNTLKKLGKGYFDILFPDMHPEQAPIVDKTGAWGFEPVALDSNQLILPNEYVNVNPIEKPNPDAGSNNWAVSGSKTITGNAMLSNDPHLGLSLPSIWYTIQLTAPGMNVNGASLPGLPMVISGYNESIAWGETNAQRDLVDWYKVEFQDKSKSHYLLDDKWEETSRIIEQIHIRNGSTFYDTVYYTSWGPVVYDDSFHAEKSDKNYAMRWITHEGSNEVMTFYQLNKAKNHADYLDALTHYDSPAQNFVFASVNGDIAIKVQGKYPLKWKNQGKFLMDGTKSSQDWQGYIPNEHNAHWLNPERGFVSSANQHPADSTYPYYVYSSQFEYYRNRRINQRLTEMNNITPQDMMALQNDNYNLQASEILPHLLENINADSLKGSEQAAYQFLANWNYYNEPNSKAPIFYENWFREILKLSWDEMNPEKSTKFKKPSRFTTIKLLKTKPNFPLFDIVETSKKETASDIIKMAFKESVIAVERWKEKNNGALDWAEFKHTKIGHLADITGALSALSRKVFNGGYRGVVNATSETFGPSWRMVVELDPKGVKAWGLYPGGQSGNPGSPHYDDQVTKWESGVLYPLLFLKNKEEKSNRIIFEQILE